ncbi:MAG: alpha/beta hydrolase [Clostridiales bacterium]|nr:alpha/beta hydrolase [Clostridiales bacterium]
MDIAKFVFDAIDVAFDKRFNKYFYIEGADDVVITKDVLYSYADTKTCLLDYYYVPKKKGLYPVIFNIHGGGFMAGGKEYRRALCTWYAVDGLFVINVDYGLCPSCHFPTPILHLVEALNWVVKNAKRLRLDLSRMAVCGDSAGGYYAAMLAAITQSEQMQKAFKVKTKAKFSAAILNCGLYDIHESLNRRMLLDLNKKIFTSYTGIEESEFSEYKYKDFCSPLPFITDGFPPTFIIYAERDIFCGGQAEHMIKELEKNDIYYESYHSVSMRRNHCFSLDWANREAKEVNALLKDFVGKMVDGTLPRRQSETDICIRECEKA